MAAKADLRVSIDADVKAGLDALAKATGRQPGAVVESALRLILDPLPALAKAQALLSAHEQRWVIMGDKLDLIADTIIDRHRAEDGETV